MAPRKQNGVVDDRRVSVDREEYDALREAVDVRLSDDEKTKRRMYDLGATCLAQARRLAEVDLTVQHLERVNGLQRVFIDLLRADRPVIASLEDLSTFWRTWFITTENLVKREPSQRDEVSKLEPDLFRSWRTWVHDVGRVSRTSATTKTRIEAEAMNEALSASSQAFMQEHIIEQQRRQNAMLVARVGELEAEVEARRKAKP